MKRRLFKIGIWSASIVLGLFLLITAGLYFFKDEICGYVISEVNNHLKAKVKVSKVDLAFWGSFPNLSVDFNDVFIQDSYKNSSSKDTLLFSERIRLKFNPIDIWNEKYNVKEIQISPGTVQLKINRKGVNNYDILKETKDKTASKFKLNMEKVALKNIRFSFKNKVSGQSYSTHIKDMDLEGAFSETEFTLESRSNLHVNHAKSGAVTLISNKPANFDLNIIINQKTGTFEIPKALVYVAGLPFNVKGIVTPEDINFRIKSDNLNLDDVVNSFAHNSVQDVKKFNGKGTVHFDARIIGKTKSTQAPETNCTFAIKGGSIVEPSKGLQLRNIRLMGRYSNEGGLANEFLKLTDVAFSTSGGPFTGNLLMTNFNSPVYQGQAKGNIDLSVAHSLFSFPKIEQISGNIDVNTDYNVETISDVNPVFYNIRKCDGDVVFKNVMLKLQNDQRQFKELNGSVYLRDDEVGMDAVSVHVGSSDIKASGVFHNVIEYFHNNGKLNATVDVHSDFVDLQDLGTETKEQQISDGKNWNLPADLEGNVTLHAGEIKYEKHRFKQFNGDIELGERLFHFSNVNVQNANADIRGNVTIEERSPEIFTITTQLASDNIEFKSLFREWNNFEQDIITEDNIFGKVHVLLDFTAPFDLKNGVIKNEIVSKIQLKILEGRLKNVSTFKSITESLKTSSAKYVLRKNNINDFEKRLLDLKFETLENTLVIHDGLLEIPAMTVKSSALDMELFGKHGFDGKIDYRFAFRYREIKTQKNQDEFGTIIDDGSGLKIYIKMTGTSDKPIIEWDQDAKKEQAQQNREAAKQDAKSIFKTEFGLFKNDTSVKIYQPVKQAKEELHMEFGPAKKDEPVQEIKKEKKDSKINKALKKWKDEADKSKKEGVDIGE